MAVWCLASQFLLVALLSWNVHCFPAKKGWSQTEPAYEGSFPEGYPKRSYKPSLNPAPELSNVASLKHSSYWGPEEETAPSSFVPGPDIFPPPPPQFQAGELAHFEESYEHGGDERETQDQGPMLIAPQLGGFASTQEASGVQQFLRPDYQSQYYLFLTGQLPPGTVTHSQSEYEQGRDHWDDVHYERYGFPIVSLPAQNQYVPALGSSQNPGQLSHYAAQPTPRLDYFLPTKQR